MSNGKKGLGEITYAKPNPNVKPNVKPKKVEGEITMADGSKVVTIPLPKGSD